jgi:hypothetical protein
MLKTLTFLRAVDETLTAPWLKRFSDLGMECELHPDFSFSNHSGFLPIQLMFREQFRGHSPSARFLTGFELYITELDLDAQFPARAGVLARLFGRNIRVSDTVDPILTKCAKQLTFRWGSSDVFELRMASLSSLILAEIGNGISYYPADNIWYERNEAVSEALLEIGEYEAGLAEEEFHCHPFEGWI